MYMFNLRYCCYSKPILDVADNKYAELAAVLMLNKYILLSLFKTKTYLMCLSNDIEMA
jgi:hypothetical protein